MANVRPLWSSDPVICDVRAELARRGLSVNRLAKITGTGQSYWARRMVGETEFSVHDLTTLAEVLRVEPGVFFTGWCAARDSNPEPTD